MKKLIIAGVFVNNFGAIRTALEGKTETITYTLYAITALILGLAWITMESVEMFSERPK